MQTKTVYLLSLKSLLLQNCSTFFYITNRYCWYINALGQVLKAMVNVDFHLADQYLLAGLRVNTRSTQAIESSNEHSVDIFFNQWNRKTDTMRLPFIVALLSYLTFQVHCLDPSLSDFGLTSRMKTKKILPSPPIVCYCILFFQKSLSVNVK